MYTVYYIYVYVIQVMVLTEGITWYFITNWFRTAREVWHSSDKKMHDGIEELK